MLTIKNISLKIKEKHILDNVSIEVNKGERIALLGPNGAGKSSLVDIITGAVKPENGEVLVIDQPFRKVKDKVGVLYEYVPLFYYSKVKEILAYVCSVYGINKSDIIEIVNSLGIDKIENKLVKVLSKGERKKVGVLMAILHNPEFVILDEPTSDLDPFMREKVWNLFLRGGRTVFFTTHLWEEAEKIADLIIFISNGKIIAKDTPKGFLSNKYLSNKKKVILPNDNFFDALTNGEYFYRNEQELIIYSDNVEEFVLKNNLKNYTISDVDLKDVFHYLSKINEQ